MAGDGPVPVLSSRLTGHRLRRLLIGVAIVLTAAEGVMLAALHDEAVWEAEQKALGAARLVENHVNRVIQGAEFLTAQVAELAQGRPMDKIGSDEEAWKRLMALRQGLPEPGTLWIIGPDGRTRLGTIYFPTPTTEVKDRHYFTEQLKPGRGTVIGPMVQTKNRDIQAFHVSRRIEDQWGHFVGVAVVGIDTPSFIDLYHSLGLGPGSNLTVTDRSGRLILRVPDPSRWVGTLTPDGPLEQLVRSGRTQGTLRAISPLDGVERIVAFIALPRYDLIVATGLAVEDALILFWEVAWASLAGLALLLGALAWVGHILKTSAAREQAMFAELEASLAERTHDAEARAEEARLANDSKTRFLATASHDLRQPLQAAGMFAEVLAVKLEGTPHQGVVDKLRRSVESTQTLLSTLLDLSTLEAGHIQPNVTAFPVASLLSNLASEAEIDANARGLALRAVASEQWVVSDPVLLERLLRNLVVNALRYTQKGAILLGCRRRGRHLAVCVVDTGVGIAADKLATIFDDFTRLGEKGSGADRGLGLGLSVVRRMATLLDHPVEVHSVPGKGSCFAVLVPLVK